MLSSEKFCEIGFLKLFSLFSLIFSTFYSEYLAYSNTYDGEGFVISTHKGNGLFSYPSNNLVFNQNGAALTNSLLVAEKFGKNHFDVTKAIKKLNDSQQNCSQFFKPSTYTDTSGKSNPMYIMNRDGFTLLAMGFTGKLFLRRFKMSCVFSLHCIVFRVKVANIAHK